MTHTHIQNYKTTILWPICVDYDDAKDWLSKTAYPGKFEYKKRLWTLVRIINDNEWFTTIVAGFPKDVRSLFVPLVGVDGRVMFYHYITILGDPNYVPS